jgi:hypothetical protein
MHLREVLSRAERQSVDTHRVAESLAEEFLDSARLAKAS